MRSETKHYVLGMLACVAIVSGAALWAGSAHATPLMPSASDYKWLAQAKGNQPILNKDRPAFTRVTQAVKDVMVIESSDLDEYNSFVLAKRGNQSLSMSLADDGWQIKWDTMTLVPLAK